MVCAETIARDGLDVGGARVCQSGPWYIVAAIRRVQVGDVDLEESVPE